MERQNLRLNPSAFQGFSMADTFHQHQAADAAFFPASADVPETHLLPPGFIQYNSAGDLAQMNTRIHLSPNYDIPLELDFNRLSLSAPPPPPETVMAAPPVNGGGRGSIIRGNSSVDMSRGSIGFSSYTHINPQFSNGDIQRMRIEQMGLFMQRENLEISNYELANAYNNINPLTNRNGFRSPNYHDIITYGNLLNWINRNNANLQHRAAASTDDGIIKSNSSDSPDYSSVYRSRNGLNFSCLDDLRGKILLVAEDPCGCQFLQNKFKEKKEEEIQMIFLEIKDHISELMMHHFGNLFIQKFFELCTEEQITQLLLVLISNERAFKDLCMHFHGTRAVQKMIECLTTADQNSLLMSVLKHITFALTKSSCGNHVIQHCLQFFRSEHKKHILNVVADNCLEIATDRSGCCVIQQCVNHAHGEPGDRLTAEITSNALILSEHPYGNYVVQHILCQRMPHVSANIIAQLAGSYVSLSMNKYGSNVVEKCLESKVDQVFQVINEIIHSPNFLRVLQDPYGNYVAQVALKEAKGPIRDTMVNLIHAHRASLHSHPHGKNVLASTKGSNQRE